MENKLPKQETHIRNSGDFAACYKNGKKLYTRHFILFILPQQEATGRFGLTVSKKIGNAVKRNRIKRVLREFFRLHLKNVPGIQIVAVARNEAWKLSLTRVEEELFPLLSSYICTEKN